ncbi:predicted protein [Botrytis cinerea T4]|uniref:Uncharacterized protein n=1 Tax=Botryotinia fuckeliana (strain T4) TaxID=999810 RepID=G2XTQ2_BOTF4|nr:predicted protein [Botrytis cinerea T4]
MARKCDDFKDAGMMASLRFFVSYLLYCSSSEQPIDPPKFTTSKLGDWNKVSTTTAKYPNQ